MRLFIALIISWLSDTFITTVAADENQFIKNETTPTSDSFKICNPHDFIESLKLIGHDQFITIEELNSLIKDIKHNSNMGRAFVGLLDTRQLSDIEKISWIKSNLTKLPSPFLMLLALFEPDLEEAKNLYYLSSVYFVIDAHICEGGTRQSGLIKLVDTIVPMLLKRFSIEQKNNSLSLDMGTIDFTEVRDFLGKSFNFVIGKITPFQFNQFGIEQEKKLFLEAFEKIHFTIEKQFFEKGGFNIFAKKYPKSAQGPYWLAYEIIMKEGYWRFLGGNNWPYTDTKIFKPQDQWEKITQDVCKTMEERAITRQIIGK